MERVSPLKRFYDTIDKGDIAYKLSHIPEMPTILEFEVTNHCNYHCLMCKTGVGSAKRVRGFMEDAMFAKIMEQVHGEDIAIKFVGQGEPLLHPSFLAFLRQAKQIGAVCHLTTNASMLDEAMMAGLIEAKLDSIKFSFQGINRAGYLEMRCVDAFDEMLAKIEKLHQLRGDSLYPFITVHTTTTDEPEDEIEAFRQRMQPICDTVQIGSTMLEFMDCDAIPSQETRQRFLEMSARQTQKKIRYKCCNQVFDVTTVRWNGDVSACCADNDGVMTLGNLKEHTIKDLWNGQQLNHYRDILKDNRYDDLPLCKGCYDFMGYMYDPEQDGAK